MVTHVSYTRSYSQHDGVCLNASNDEARGFPKVQGQSGLNNEYQDSQDYTVRSVSKQKTSEIFLRLHPEGLWCQIW